MWRKIFALTILLLTVFAQASAMELRLEDSIGRITLGRENFTLRLDGYTRLDGDVSKGMAVFGELYFHFDCRDELSAFGGSEPSDCVEVYVFEGLTKIYPITSDVGRTFWLLATETGGGGTMRLIGERDGEWVQYFDTMRDKRQHGVAYDFYLQDFYAEDDTLSFVYEQWGTQRRCTLRYRWDEAAHWFGVDVIR